MGRPIHKKYFGNRNIGSLSTTADNFIGGSSVASAAVTVAGSYATNRPAFTFTAPTIPGGVTAAGTVTSEVLSAAIGGSQTRAYPVTAGAISYAGGTTTATFTAAVTTGALTTVAYASATTIGFDTTTVAMISGTSIHITGASITGTMTIGGTALVAGQIYYVGSPTGATTATLYATYADAQAATAPLTIVAGDGTAGATFTRGVTYGTVTTLTPVNRGAFEALVTGAQTAVVATAGVGEGLTITPTYRGKSVIITELGSGYVAAPTIAGYTNQGGITVATIALSADTGGVPSTVTNQENSILAYAKTTSGGTVQLGDIVKQEASRRYLIKTADGTAQCKLVADDTPAYLEMYIVATDTDSNTYWVTKLTARRAVLTHRTLVGSAYLFDTDTAAGWTLGAAALGVVSITNA